MYSLILKRKILIIIILIGAILRLYKLADYPINLNHDEITQLYDAISIAQTGKDIYGNFLPFIFPSVGDFKPPFYTYAVSVFYFLFGWKEITVRLPAAFFGILIIPVIYLFTLKFLKDKTISLTAAFFTAIAPFEIYFSRKSFENGAGILLMLIGFISLFKYFEYKRSRWLYISSIVFAAGMYTYFSHAVVIPLLAISFIFTYRHHFSFKLNLFPIILFIILIAPLIFLSITDVDVRYRSQTVFIKQDRSLGSLLELEQTINPLINFLSRANIVTNYIFDRYLKQFDPSYLFGNGLDLTNQGLLGSGPLLFIQAPFLLMGLIYLLREKKLSKEKKIMLSWILVGMLPSALTFEQYSPHRVVVVFTMLNIAAAVGFYFFLKLISLYKKYFYHILLFTLFLFGINIIYFLHIYFINYSFEKSEFLQYPFKQISEFVWSEYPNVDSIVFDPQFGDVAPRIGVGGHYYLAYYGYYPPAKFQREFHIGDKEREVIFDKFSVRQVYWPTDKDLKNTLLIASPWSVPENDITDKSKIIQRFYFYDGKLAFYAIKYIF